jgi:glucose-6-phosphate 1-epimerase
MIDTLQDEFGIPGAVAVTPGVNGLPKVVLTHASGAGAEVYLHGGHVTSWTDARGEELLFVSRESRFEPKRPIRGGIPIPFPQFGGKGPLVQHGFARTCEWDLVGTSVGDSGAVSAILRLADSEETRAVWPHPFQLTLNVSLEDTALSLTAAVANTGSERFSFQLAFHTYFGVGDIKRTSVHGLQGVTYIDDLRGGEKFVEDRSVIEFDREIDRVYENALNAIRMEDRLRNRTITVEKREMPDVVVWNPWIDRAAQIADLGNDEYLRMLCIETGRISVPCELAPSEKWTGETRFDCVQHCYTEATHAGY